MSNAGELLQLYQKSVEREKLLQDRLDLKEKELEDASTRFNRAERKLEITEVRLQKVF